MQLKELKTPRAENLKRNAVKIAMLEMLENENLNCLLKPAVALRHREPNPREPRCASASQLLERIGARYSSGKSTLRPTVHSSIFTVYIWHIS